MKVNLDYYKSNEFNKLTAEEMSIIDKYFKGLENINVDSYDSLLTLESTFYEIQTLSDNRRNIVEFYPINSNETVLEVGAGFGEITGSFLDRAKEVISIESKKEKAEVIGKRYNLYSNLTVYAGEIENIKLKEKFDIVSLIGVIDLKTDLDKYINFAISNLKDSGKIIIGINNKLGIKYFTGVVKENCTRAYESIIHESKFIGVEDIENKLKDLGYSYKKYYPMPDYTFTNAVYTDEFLPTVDHIVSRDLECFDISKNSVDYSERDILKEFIKKDKNMFKTLANSYLLVASKEDLDIGVKAVTYGTFRKPEYRIKTIIKEKEVVKQANFKTAQKHIENIGKNLEILESYGIKVLDTFEKDCVKSRFVTDVKLLDKILLNIAESGDLEGFVKELKTFFDKVIGKLEKISVSDIIDKNVFDKYEVSLEKHGIDINDFTFVKYGIYDLIPQNCFVIDNDYYVYDQEWMEENVPLEYILFRIILNLPEAANYIDIKEVYERFNLTKYCKMFEELDGKIQNSLRNEVFWETHMKSIKSILQKEGDFNKTLYDKDVHIKNLEVMISDLNEKIASYEKQVAVISNSLSWKITKPFRYIWWIINPFSKKSFLDRILPPGGRRRLKYDEKLAKKLWEKKIDGYRVATDEEGVEYWKGIEHRERLLRERTEDRKKLGEWSFYEYWMEANNLTEEELEIQRKTKFKKKPKISIVVPLYNTPEDLFRELIFNLYRQTYSNWELCLADGSNEPLENIQKMCKDSRIKYKYLGKNLGISGNSNEGIKMATGDWIALLDHDDLLKIDALFEIVKVINERPNVRFIYTDEDKMTSIDNIRFDAHFKPDFSPDYLRGNNYICHFSVFKKEVMDKLEGFRDEYNGAQDLDIILRMSEIVDAKDIYHIPKVLYHWRVWETSTAGNPETKLYAYESGKKAVQDHINRIGLKGTVERDMNIYGAYRVKYDVDQDNEKVSIIVYGNNEEKLSKCIDSIKTNTSYSNYEMLKLDNIDNLYSDLNVKVKEATGKFIVFVNSSLEFNDSEWLTDLIGFARRENTGAVGGKILDENGNISFTSKVVTEKGFIDLNKDLNSKEYGYFSKECHIQNVTSVSLKLMAIEKDKFDKAGGFNEEYKELSDVELNLKLLDLGYLNVYDPYVVVTIHEDETFENKEQEEKEIKEIITKRNIVLDKYFNINFDQEKNNYEIRKDKVNL